MANGWEISLEDNESILKATGAMFVQLIDKLIATELLNYF